MLTNKNEKKGETMIRLIVRTKFKISVGVPTGVAGKHLELDK